MDGLAVPGAGTFLSMRRSRFDPLEPPEEPRWYTVRNTYGKLLEARQLPPGSDLKNAFITAMLEWIDAGWRLEEFSSTAGTWRSPEPRIFSD